MKKFSHFIIIFLTTLILSIIIMAQWPCSPGNENIGIKGRVIDGAEPVSGIYVELGCCMPLCPEVPYPSTKTDSNGYYIFKIDELSKEPFNYKVTAKNLDQQGCVEVFYDPANAPVTAPTINFKTTPQECNCPISDIRLKTEIKELKNVLEKLEQIKGVTFEWNNMAKKFGKSSNHREIGVIAQDVEKVFPELIIDGGDKSYKGIDYSRLTAVLIEAVKELKKENESLKERIEVLEKRQ